MNQNYTIFWGDTHHNTYQGYQQDPPLSAIMSYAATCMDFYTGAYYTAAFRSAPLREGAGEAVATVKGGLLRRRLQLVPGR